MRKSFRIWPPNEPAAVIQLGVVLLLVANLVALYFMLWPIGGSPEQLRAQVTDVRAQIRQKQGGLERTKALASKIESGRSDADDFMDDYFVPSRAAYSTVLTELTKDAADSNIKSKESAWAKQPIDGSDTLSMMKISANYECTYQDLIRFINLLDKSDSLLIIEALNATPQQGSNILNVVLKLDTFVREDGP